MVDTDLLSKRSSPIRGQLHNYWGDRNEIGIPGRHQIGMGGRNAIGINGRNRVGLGGRNGSDSAASSKEEAEKLTQQALDNGLFDEVDAVEPEDYDKRDERVFVETANADQEQAETLQHLVGDQLLDFDELPEIEDGAADA